MWSDFVYLLPLGSLLCWEILDEDTKLDGEFQEEFSKLLERKSLTGTVRIYKNPTLDLRVARSYSKGSTLWAIMSDVIETQNLHVHFLSSEDGVVRFELQKGKIQNGSSDSGF